MHARLWWTHAAFDPAALRGQGRWAVAVIDCLRATTSIAAALWAGCTAVRPVAAEDEARAVAAGCGAVLAGERDCLPPDGFDLGNSPRAFTPATVGGREVVLWTTNGTRALVAAAPDAAELLATGLVNVTAVARYLVRHHWRQIAIVCAGTEGAFSLEDTFTAGALLERLAEEGHSEMALDEGATAAQLLYRGGRSDPRGVLDATAAAAKLRRHGLGDDVIFAAQEGVLPVVPRWEAGALRLLS